MTLQENNTTITNPVGVSNNVFLSLQITGFCTFLVGFPTNLIIIYLVMRRRRLRKPTNFFVSSLATADVMVLTWLLIWILGIKSVLSTEIVIRYIIPSIDIFLGVASMVNVACVSADRLIAVVYPLKYEFIMTRRRSYCVILAVWIYAIALLIAAFIRICWKAYDYQNAVLYAGFLSYFVPVIVIVISYSVILLVIVRKLKSIRRFENYVISAPPNCNENNHEKIHRKKLRRRKLLRELKITANILLIVFPFTTGWSYFIGIHIYEHAYKNIIVSDAHNIAMIIIPWVLSGLNPIVYLLLNRSLRKALLETVKRLCRDSADTMEDTSFFTSFSRKASNAFRRASAGLEEGSAGLLMVPKFFQMRRDSRRDSGFSRRDSGLSMSIPSRSSCEVVKELSISGNVLHEVDEKETNSSVM